MFCYNLFQERFVFQSFAFQEHLPSSSKQGIRITGYIRLANDSNEFLLDADLNIYLHVAYISIFAMKQQYSLWRVNVEA